MIAINITADFADVAKRLDQMRSDVASQALARAVNRTLEQARTAMSREIRAEFNISRAKVDQALVIRRATPRAGVYAIEGRLESPAKRGRSLNLINFDARETGKGVTVKIKKGGPRKFVRGAFIANQGRTVFIRTGKKRLPIEARQTIDISQMFNTRRINKRVLQFMRTRFAEIFEREARFYTERFNRGAGR